MSNQTLQHDEAVELLCQLECAIQKAVLRARNADHDRELAGVATVTSADTIYAIDHLCEDVILKWFAQHWPAQCPVELVMEGLEDRPAVTFPEETALADTVYKCIMDPIDGTRNMMFDKRSAWVLAGLAPQRFEANTLQDVEVAVMTELPISRQTLADQICAVKGQGIRATRDDLVTGQSTPVSYRPSQATEVRHAFGTVSRFFPDGMTLLAQLEETFWRHVGGDAPGGNPVVFNDQYISTGGQFYEVLAGHDRFIADLRPLAFTKLGLPQLLVCHPYDVAAALVLTEAGCVLEQPDGSPLDCPLDTVSPVNWVAYANPALAERLRPILQQTIAEVLSD